MLSEPTQRQPFALEQAYRETFAPGLLDLSSSAATSPSLSDLLAPNVCGVLSECSLGYEPGGGSYELRAAVAGLYDGLPADDVLITAGALEAIRAVAMALVSPRQRVLVQRPAYGALRQAVVDAGGEPVDLCSDAAAQLDLTSLEGVLPNIAFLNSPHGPSGALVRGLESYRGRLVVDEVYRPIALAPSGRIPSCVETSDTAVAVGDLSKPLGLGGLRIGWIASRDRDVIRRCAGALDYLSGSVSSLSARVALHALQRFDSLLSPHIDEARDNLSLLAAFVEQHRDVVDWTPPQAGYTACLRLRAGPPAAALFDRLRDQGIFLLDGAVFEQPECLRIGLGMPQETLRNALDLLGEELCRLPETPLRNASRADVIFYTKLPRPGEAKSRLAAGIGAEAASRLAGAFFEDSLRLAQDESSRLFAALASQDGLAELASALPDACVFAQRGLDMGRRLGSAFDEAFARGAHNPVLIGSDSPTLPGHLLSVASKALETHDVVLGPARDGGYYAIGLRQPQPALFEYIDWSTERVLDQTLERARCAGLRVWLLPYWYDVDTVDDLDRLREDARPGSATYAALNRETT